jgi:hypothetical protein
MKTIEDLLIMTEEQLYAYVKSFLTDRNIPYNAYKGHYIVTEKHIKPCPLICVHLDIAAKVPPTKKQLLQFDGIIFCDVQKGGCLGADDRAGVWIALTMIETGTRTDFEYGFFLGEESGCIGSNEYARDCNEHTCFIGLDRASKDGKQNIATYGYDDNELINLFGYPKSYGSFTDCSSLAGSEGKACVNLSVGYQYEHSSLETLNTAQMNETLQVMLSVIVPDRNYPVRYLGRRYNASAYYNNWQWADYEEVNTKEPILCECCSEHAPLYQVGKYQVCQDCFDYVTDEIGGNDEKIRCF